MRRIWGLRLILLLALLGFIQARAGGGEDATGMEALIREALDKSRLLLDAEATPDAPCPPGERVGVRGCYLDFVRGQVEYVVGRKEFETSFLIGVGRRSPEHPHHRGAHTGPGDPRNRMLHELTGAMVGGPEHVGGGKFVWRDADESFVSSEVALDYQVNCIGALAGLVSLGGSRSRPPRADPEPRGGGQ